MIQIFRGLQYLNSQKPKIIHYDMKPNNILFHRGEIKIADFGLSKLIEDSSSDNMELTSPGYGSYWYLPPECFAVGEGHSTPVISSKVDVWSVGIIFYQLLYGKRPVGHDLQAGKVLIDKILNSKELEFPEKPLVSQEAKDFIKRCVNVDVRMRPEVSTIFQDPYLDAFVPSNGKLSRRKSTLVPEFSDS
jgi:tousled-like kinase